MHDYTTLCRIYRKYILIGDRKSDSSLSKKAEKPQRHLVPYAALTNAIAQGLALPDLGSSCPNVKGARARARVLYWRRDGPLRQNPCQKVEEIFNGWKRASGTMHTQTCMVPLGNLHGWTFRSAWFRFRRCMDGLENRNREGSPSISIFDNSSDLVNGFKVLFLPFRNRIEPRCHHEPLQPLW